MKYNRKIQKVQLFLFILVSANLTPEVSMLNDTEIDKLLGDENTETQRAIEDLRILLSHADHIQTRVELIQFLNERISFIRLGIDADKGVRESLKS